MYCKLKHFERSSLSFKLQYSVTDSLVTLCLFQYALWYTLAVFMEIWISWHLFGRFQKVLRTVFGVVPSRDYHQRNKLQNLFKPVVDAIIVKCTDGNRLVMLTFYLLLCITEVKCFLYFDIGKGQVIKIMHILY